MSLSFIYSFIYLFIYFWCYGVSLVKFRCWSKFHVSIITGSGVEKIFVYKGLTRNQEIRKTLV